MNDEHTIDTPTTRGSFLRRVAKLTAIGLGVALVPATNAWAPQDQCCPYSGCTGCPTGQRGFLCNGSCGGCCACLTDTSCFFTSKCPC
jgi:hypothetical protein